jgi:hypothetical protein
MGGDDLKIGSPDKSQGDGIPKPVDRHIQIEFPDHEKTVRLPERTMKEKVEHKQEEAHHQGKRY